MPDTFEVIKRNHEEIRHVLAVLQQGTVPVQPDGSQPSGRMHLVHRLIAAASKQEAAEERLQPAVQRLGPEAARIVGQAIGQSRMAKRILVKLTAAIDAETETSEQLSAGIAAAWREHIAFEERQVMPVLRQAVQGDQGIGRRQDQGVTVPAARRGESVTTVLNHLRAAAASHATAGPSGGEGQALSA